MLAIFKRELKSYFYTPIGYIFCGMFLLISGITFSLTTLRQQSTASLSMYFIYLIIMFAILIPLLTMKLFSEDRRSKTEQVLLTAPISIISMVLGKFLAAFTLFAVTLLVNSFNFVLLFIYGTPNLAVILANILGLLFIGMAFIAIGIFLSSLTENQLIAAISSMGIIIAVLLVSLIVNSIQVEFIRVVIKWFSILDRYTPFSNNMLDISAIIYFISFSAVFLLLTARVYEKRRWS